MRACDDNLLAGLAGQDDWYLRTDLQTYSCAICGVAFHEKDRHGAGHLLRLGPDKVAAIHTLAAIFSEAVRFRADWVLMVGYYRRAIAEILGHPIPPDLLHVAEDQL